MPFVIAQSVYLGFGLSVNHFTDLRRLVDGLNTFWFESCNLDLPLCS